MYMLAPVMSIKKIYHCHLCQQRSTNCNKHILFALLHLGT
jgi:hypothetical protein